MSLCITSATVPAAVPSLNRLTFSPHFISHVCLSSGFLQMELKTLTVCANVNKQNMKQMKKNLFHFFFFPKGKKKRKTYKPTSEFSVSCCSNVTGWWSSFQVSLMLRSYSTKTRLTVTTANFFFSISLFFMFLFFNCASPISLGVFLCDWEPFSTFPHTVLIWVIQTRARLQGFEKV